MAVSVSTKPTSTGTYSYEARVGHRTSSGYRKTQAEAFSAGKEDEGMLVSCAITERMQREAEEEKEAA
jgi:hypothetical protein